MKRLIIESTLRGRNAGNRIVAYYDEDNLDRHQIAKNREEVLQRVDALNAKAGRNKVYWSDLRS